MGAGIGGQEGAPAAEDASKCNRRRVLLKRMTIPQKTRIWIQPLRVMEVFRTERASEPLRSG